MQAEDVLHSLALSREQSCHPSRIDTPDNRNRDNYYKTISTSFKLLKDNLPAHLATSSSIAKILSYETSYPFTKQDIDHMVDGAFDQISALTLLKALEFQGILYTVARAYTDLNNPASHFFSKIAEYSQQQSVTKSQVEYQ